MPKPSRSEVTRWLSLMLMRDVFNVPSDPRFYWASEVSLENKLYEPGKPRTVRPDFMQFVPLNQTAGGLDRGEFIAYEVKSCVADFRSDHGHNMVGDKNYYIMPAGVFESLMEKNDGRLGWLNRACMHARAGVYVPVQGRELDGGEWERFYESESPYMALLNPFTGKRDCSHLQCVSNSDRNRRRLYSNTELLFSMLRSAGRDRPCYEDSYWRDSSFG